MKTDITSYRTGRVFYGWIALAGAMLSAVVAGGVFVYSFGVFLPVMCDDFGWSRAIISVGFSLGLLAFGLPSPLAGYIVAKFGPRVNLIWGNVVGALALAGMYFVQDVWHVYVLYIIAGLGSGLGGYIASSTVANNWFVRKRALAMGLFTAGGAMGGFIFPPLATLLISSYGWRLSWVALAGTTIVFAVIISGVFLIRNKPENMGLLPDGDSVTWMENVEQRVEQPEIAGDREVWKIGKAMRMPTTWLIAILAGANFYALGTMIAHQVAHVQDIGYSPVTAALTMSLVSGVGIAARIGCGVTALKLDIKNLVKIGIVIQLISLCILMTTKNLTFIYIYATLYGLSNGIMATAVPTIVSEYFGRASYAQIMGVIFAFGITVESVAPAIAGAIFDATNTYRMAFVIVAVFSLVGLLSVFLLKKPKQ